MALITTRTNGFTVLCLRMVSFPDLLLPATGYVTRLLVADFD